MLDKKTPKKVLLVDDELDFLEATSTALSRRGFVIGKAKSGPEALSKLEIEQFDLIVLDLKMPGMDGVEVLRRIRMISPAIPVFILTGHGSPPDAFRTAKLGIVYFLSKPIDIDILAEKLSGALEFPEKGTPELTMGQKPRLLIVDDEEDLLASLSRVLSRRGLDVETAANALKALEVLEKRLIEVAILDIKMPGMDGIELLSKMKELYPHIEVIFLTGHPSKDTAFQSMKGGAFQYVTKPPDIEELTACVFQALERQQKRREAEFERAVREALERNPDF